MPANYRTDLTREQWLLALAERMERTLFAAESLPRYRVSCSFPSTGGTRARRRVLGECHAVESSDDQTSEVIVSPVIGDPVEAGAVLAHELAHVATPGHAHDRTFAALVQRIGLEGKPTSTTPGDAFRAWMDAAMDEVGPYPHAAINLSGRKKQGTRMLAFACPCSEDPYRVRTTRKQADRGAPVCPLCGAPMMEG